MVPPCKSNGDIFERLFKDSQIKRITYRRPCHFSSTSYSNRHFLTKCEPETNNTRLSANSFSKLNNMNDSYNKTYMFRNTSNFAKEHPFKPNITPIKPVTPTSKGIVKMLNFFGYDNYNSNTITPTMQGMFKEGTIKTTPRTKIIYFKLFKS